MASELKVTPAEMKVYTRQRRYVTKSRANILAELAEGPSRPPGPWIKWNERAAPGSSHVFGGASQ